MADTRISALPETATLVGTEQVPIVQDGTTKKVTAQQIADLATSEVVSRPSTEILVGTGASYSSYSNFKFTGSILNLGNAVSTNQNIFRIGQGTASIDLGCIVDAPNAASIHFNELIPDSTNYTFARAFNAVLINSPGTIQHQINTTNISTASSSLYTFLIPSRFSGNVEVGTAIANKTFLNYGQATFTATVTASGALARANYINPSLTAAANNDVLVGLDITPTFNTGAFTGVGSLGLRTSSALIGNPVHNPTSLGILRIGQGTSRLDIGEGSFNGAGYITMWASQTTPTSTNCFLNANNNFLSFNNGTSAAGSVNFQIATANRFLIENALLTFTPGTAAGSTSQTSFIFTKPNNTGQVASVAVVGWQYNGGSRTWNAGAIAEQSENVWGATTYAFASASTIALANGNVFTAPVAGTNATITRSYAIKSVGNLKISTGTLNIASIPTSSAGLITGDVWNDSGTLKIV